MASYDCVAYIFAASYLLLEEEPSARKLRSVWMRDWVKKRHTDGSYAKLLGELREHQPKLYKNFLRPSPNEIDFLLDLVTWLM